MSVTEANTMTVNADGEYCIFCGQPNPTEQVQLKSTYTDYQDHLPGNKACVRCNTMLNDGFYRKCSYYIRDNQPPTKIENVLEFIDNMPPPPYILHTTIQGRKHTWKKAVRNPVLNTDNFRLVFKENIIQFNRSRYNFLKQQAQHYINKSVGEGSKQKWLSKKWLTIGQPPVSIIIFFNLTLTEVQFLKSVRDDLLWHFILTFMKNPNWNQKPERPRIEQQKLIK